MPTLVERNDPMLKNKHKKQKFSNNCRPKISLIRSKNGHYLAIDLSFGNIEKEEIGFDKKSRNAK